MKAIACNNCKQLVGKDYLITVSKRRLIPYSLPESHEESEEHYCSVECYLESNHKHLLVSDKQYHLVFKSLEKLRGKKRKQFEQFLYNCIK